MGTIFSLIKLAGVFFFNSWLVMVFVGLIASELGISKITYVESLLVTISLWVVVAPIAYMAGRVKFSEAQNW
jgi:hypothetical protein